MFKQSLELATEYKMKIWCGIYFHGLANYENVPLNFFNCPMCVKIAIYAVIVEVYIWCHLPL